MSEKLFDWKKTPAAVWRNQKQQLRPVKLIDPIRLSALLGIDSQKQQLVENTQRFIAGKPANSALLWGARGTGKSSLIKAILNEYFANGLRLVEVYKNDLSNLPEIVDELRDLQNKFIIYCDDFSFDEHENTYIALKTILDGSIEVAPSNVILYVTSNRRHLMPEYMKDNRDTQIIDGELHYSDAVEEKISLSDRFGLWISFYGFTMQEYLSIVAHYFDDYSGDKNQLFAEAKKFAQRRASHSGRTAKQFYNYFSQQITKK